MQLTYSVANAAGTSTGTIVLQPPALTTANSVPKADNIDAQVRTDGIVSVDVLDHVTYSRRHHGKPAGQSAVTRQGHVQGTGVRFRRHRTLSGLDQPAFP